MCVVLCFCENVFVIVLKNCVFCYLCVCKCVGGWLCFLVYESVCVCFDLCACVF